MTSAVIILFIAIIIIMFRGNIIYQPDSDETLSIRDPETRANSDGRTNGTSHLTEVADAEEAEKEEVHTLNLLTIYIIYEF